MTGLDMYLILNIAAGVTLGMAAAGLLWLILYASLHLALMD